MRLSPADRRRYDLFNPTDTEVLDAVNDIRRAYQTSETRAQRRFEKEREAAFAFFGHSDVERVARDNKVHRAEIELAKKLSKVRELRKERLDLLRRTAGQWAELVGV